MTMMVKMVRLVQRRHRRPPLQAVPLTLMVLRAQAVALILVLAQAQALTQGKSTRTPPCCAMCHS